MCIAHYKRPKYTSAVAEFDTSQSLPSDFYVDLHSWFRPFALHTSQLQRVCWTEPVSFACVCNCLLIYRLFTSVCFLSAYLRGNLRCLLHSNPCYSDPSRFCVYTRQPLFWWPFQVRDELCRSMGQGKVCARLVHGSLIHIPSLSSPLTACTMTPPQIPNCASIRIWRHVSVNRYTKTDLSTTST